MKDFVVLSKQDAEREKRNARYNPAIDCGAKGRIFENRNARPKSNKKDVSGAGKNDNYIKYNNKYVPAESKTNGGRVDSLLDGSNKSKFIIYEMDVVIKHKAGKRTPEWTEHRYVESIIVPTKLFLDCITEVNAIKPMYHGGEYDGIGIQVSSKKLYQRLLQWPVKYDRTKDYTSADFEGLTL